MSFGPLHDLFQRIYEDHFEAQDDLAERIKAIGGHAEGTLAGMIKRSKIEEHNGHASDTEMIKMMLDAQETVAHTLIGACDIAAECGDKLTEDLCIGRAREHQKFAWMLKSHISKLVAEKSIKSELLSHGDIFPRFCIFFDMSAPNLYANLILFGRI